MNNSVCGGLGLIGGINFFICLARFEKKSVETWGSYFCE